LLAWIFDVLIVTGLYLGSVILSLGVLAFLAMPLLFVINIAYRIWTLNQYSATLGMRLTGIEIRNAKGEPLNQTESIWHTLIFVFSFISILGIVANIAAMLLTERGQGLHDLILGTTAINRPAD
jgi:uncharacterized RDD family membrane protein YckC